MTWAAREIWSMREGRRWAEPPQPTAQRRSAATKNQPGAWPTGLRLLLPSAGLPTPLEAGSTPTSLQAEPAEKKEISWEHGAGQLLAAREMEPERSCSAGGPGAAPAQLGADLPSCPAAAPRLLGVPMGGAGKGDAGPASPLPEGNLHPPDSPGGPQAASPKRSWHFCTSPRPASTACHGSARCNNPERKLALLLAEGKATQTC